MTPQNFTDAVTDGLRRRGARFRPEEVEAFTAVAWLQQGRRPDPDVWAERFLAAMARRDDLRAKEMRRSVRRWAVWAAGCTVVGLLGTLAASYSFTQWPSSTLFISFVVLIVAAVTLSRVPIDSRVVRWIWLVVAVTLLSVVSLIVLLLSVCHRR